MSLYKNELKVICELPSNGGIRPTYDKELGRQLSEDINKGSSIGDICNLLEGKFNGKCYITYEPFCKASHRDMGAILQNLLKMGYSASEINFLCDTYKIHIVTRKKRRSDWYELSSDFLGKDKMVIDRIIIRDLANKYNSSDIEEKALEAKAKLKLSLECKIIQAFKKGHKENVVRRIFSHRVKKAGFASDFENMIKECKNDSLDYFEREIY